jgi:hypothetical protein
MDGRSKIATLAVGAMLFFLGILIAFAGFFTLAQKVGSAKEVPEKFRRFVLSSRQTRRSIAQAREAES